MNLKNVICDSVEFAPRNFIESIDGNDVTFYSGKDFERIVTRNGVFNESSKTENAGKMITQTLLINCEGEDSRANLFDIPGIFRLTFVNGDILIWGSLVNPVRSKTNNSEDLFLNITFERAYNAFQK